MNKITYDKPFKTYDELIELLVSRNIIINNRDFVIHAFSNFSYYSIVNGYKNTFLTLPGTDNFINGTKFEDLYLLNIIDTELNNILFKYILYIEKSLKSKLSYRVSEKYGISTNKNIDFSFDKNDYLNHIHYSNSSGMRKNIICKLKKCINENQNNNIIKHYTNIKNHLPPWIITNIIPFGLTINWYRILKDVDKEFIVTQFIANQELSLEKNKEFLIKAFELSKNYRNIIAHGSKILGLDNLPVLPKEQLLNLSCGLLSEHEYTSKLGQNDIYSVFILILILINDTTLLRNFYFDCHVFFYKYKGQTFNNKTIYEVFKLPSDMLQKIEIFLSNKINIK